MFILFILSLISSLFFPFTLQAQYSKISKAMTIELDRWTSQAHIEELLEEAPKIQGEPLNVTVKKQDVIVEGRRWTLGKSYMRVLIKSPIDKVKKLLTSPEHFQSIYRLDAPTLVKGEFKKEINKLKSGDFLARIYKEVPVFEDQDYILSYRSFQQGIFWFQRASLVKDLKNFALRNSIQILQPIDDNTTVFREISLIYLLRWYLRLLGPQVRGVVRSELQKLAKAFKCISESSANNLQLASRQCWL